MGECYCNEGSPEQFETLAATFEVRFRLEQSKGCVCYTFVVPGDLSLLLWNF